ncbi:hypothetical protein LOCC1_G003298 [Lachnellula occidentalis]|uniref:Zn(2)-C6 fungal-type domain-containing protein n=1 Tax=Lachnellula occidentalis TaxID=215460 RepID=A0A8H8UG30_9HELO|nr:hypothetical protein LOCC1_G003298 [Lachnellula occidentalis]
MSPPSEYAFLKKPRASKPKVKSGCYLRAYDMRKAWVEHDAWPEYTLLTSFIVRQRRVKCDETKPACLRCTNFGRKCGGYPSQEESPPAKEVNLPGPRRLLSKGLIRRDSTRSITRSPSPSPSPFPPPVPRVTSPRSLMPPGVVFQDQVEYQYFCHFRDETSIELATGFEPALWNKLVLQACDSPSILQLTVATAALSLATKAPHSNLWDSQKEAHRQHALQQYGEALKGIQTLVATGQDSMRIALISALLIFCFESLHGDLRQAIVQVQSAIDMIVKRISNNPQAYHFSRVNALGIPESAAIDGDLITAFMRLDRPSLTLLSKRKENAPILTSRIFTLLFSEEHLELPRGFASTAEARVYLEDLKWRVLTTTQPPISVTSFWEEELEEENSPDFGIVPLQLKQWYEGSGALNSSSNLALEFAYWHDAFSPLLNYAMSPLGESMFLGAVTLHVQALAADLLVSGSSASTLSSRRPSYSQSTSAGSSAGNSNRFPTIQAILSLSRQLVAHPNFVKGFVFDIGIIPSLTKVIMVCPDRNLKQQAIDVLKSMEPRREGLWDSSAVALAGEISMEGEDGRMDLGMIDPSLLETL